jgi:hypothetical protein
MSPTANPDRAAIHRMHVHARASDGSGAAATRVRLWPGANVEEVEVRLTAALPGIDVLRVDRGRVADSIATDGAARGIARSGSATCRTPRHDRRGRPPFVIAATSTACSHFTHVHECGTSALTIST